MAPAISAALPSRSPIVGLICARASRMTRIINHRAAVAMCVLLAGTERLRQHAVLRLTVAEVDETGEATLRGSFESLDAAWVPAEGGEQAFAWKQGQELAEDAPALAKVYGALGAAPLEVTVTATG